MFFRSIVAGSHAVSVFGTTNIAYDFLRSSVFDLLFMFVPMPFVNFLYLLWVCGMPDPSQLLIQLLAFSRGSIWNHFIHALVVSYVEALSLVKLLLTLARALLDELYLTIINTVCAEDVKHCDATALSFAEPPVVHTMQRHSS